MKKLISLLCVLMMLSGCAYSQYTSADVSVSPKHTPLKTETPALIVTPSETATPGIYDEFIIPHSTPALVPSEYSLKYAVFVNRLENRVIVYSKDESGSFTKIEKVFICSVGKGPEQHNKTPLGQFYTLEKYVWRSLNGGTYGQYATRIWGAYLFHSVPYTKKNKASLKAEEYNKLGTPASQGCIRLCVRDAKWIYDNCPIGTFVYIYDLEEELPLAEKVDLIDLTNPNCRWDPTDPDVNNPWKA